MPCIPIAKLSGSKQYDSSSVYSTSTVLHAQVPHCQEPYFPLSSDSGASSASCSSSSASDSSMASTDYRCDTVTVVGSSSVFSADVIQAQREEERRQQIDADNSPGDKRPKMPIDRLLHCPGCNMYLDGRAMLQCNKGSCPKVWYRYGKLHHNDLHPVLMEVWDKQANDEWIVRRTYADKTYAPINVLDFGLKRTYQK